MKIFYKIISFIIVIVLVISSAVVFSAAYSQSLECNLDIDVELSNRILTIKAVNNNNKDIVCIKYLRSVYHNGKVYDGLTNFASLDKYSAEGDVILKKNSTDIIENKRLYIPTNYYDNDGAHSIDTKDISMEIYIYYVEFADGTVWGKDIYDIERICSLVKPIEVKCSDKSNYVNSREQNSNIQVDKDFFAGLILFLIIVVFIVMKCKKSKKNKFFNKKTSSYKTTICTDVHTEGILASDSAKKAGEEGEENIYYLIQDEISEPKFILKNLYVPKDDGKTTEIDLILIHSTGIYVIESKNYKGWIFGNEKDENWTQCLNKGSEGTEKNKLYNPVKQNYNHIKYLRKYLGKSDDIPIKSLVVFGKETELKEITLSTDNVVVITAGDLVETINAYITISDAKHRKLSEERLYGIFEKLYPLTQVSEEEKAKHISEINNMKNQNKFNNIAKSEETVQGSDKTMNTDTGSLSEGAVTK